MQTKGGGSITSFMGEPSKPEKFKFKDWIIGILFLVALIIFEHFTGCNFPGPD